MGHPNVQTSRRWESGQNTTFVGPGHPCVVGDWLIYHAWLFDHVAADQVMVHFNCFRSWQLSENRKSPEDSFWSIGSCGHPTGQTPSGQGWPVEDPRILNNLHLSSFQQLLSCRTLPKPIAYRYSCTPHISQIQRRLMIAHLLHTFEQFHLFPHRVIGKESCFIRC